MKLFIALLIVCFEIFAFAAIAQEQQIQNTSTNENNFQLSVKYFKVDANVFIAKFRDNPGLQTNSVTDVFKSFFSTSGVDWESPQGKSIFYNNRLGVLFVRATESDLHKIFQVLKSVAPQVHITARFLEISENTFQNFVAPNLFTNAAIRTGTNGWTELLTDEKFKSVLWPLEANSETVILAEPEAVITSGREIQMRAIHQPQIMMVNNFAYQENTTNSANVPVLDVVPSVLPDGYTIDLAIKASLTEFLGYEKATNSLMDPSPILRVRQFSTHDKIWDRQTIATGKLAGHFITREKMDNTQNKEVLIFITTTLVDPVGIRIHSDDELPFAKDGFPQQ
jgi:Flp pilus assembly secretin CpaC